MTIDHAVAQARELLAALDQQLLAATGKEDDEARDRVAAVAFDLMVVLERFGTEPANDQGVAPRPTHQMYEYERYRAGPGRQLMVVRCFGRFFVAEGFVAAPDDAWSVTGPFDFIREAREYAQQRSAQCSGWPARKVVQA